MSTLKKGDLVMTEHGDVLQIDIEPWEGESHIYCIDLSDMAQRAINPTIVFKPTREKVEAYLKEKGWEFIPNWKYAKEGNQYYLFQIDRIYYIFQEAGLNPSDFDTAPEQLREAITMAKLLNATKDN